MHKTTSIPFRLLHVSTILLLAASGVSHADDLFSKQIQPLLKQTCFKCHGADKDEIEGEVDLTAIKTLSHLSDDPELLATIIEAVEGGDMPPEKAPQLSAQNKTQLVSTLKDLLRTVAAGIEAPHVQINRLNRFQYNNSLRDLLRLNKDIFPLPEKLMTRHGNYVTSQTRKMPDRIDVSCLSLNPPVGFQQVQAFPKDLRALHGFDNQANQLTLSPLLLDAYLKLSVSILESPDFNEKTVGIWNDFFREPAEGADLKKEIRVRLQTFLTSAFRTTVDEKTIDRYSAYTGSKIEQGLSFTEAMKKVTSAALSSPMFLYRYRTNDADDQFELASKLSFFLWGSAPDAELLALAKAGELANPETLSKTINRMLADPKIERFLDTFPSQWMQLENILAATPDPKKHRLYKLDGANPASMQMVLEPLLLFDAVFVEDRPVIDLVSPDFSYQSEFLKTWYTTDLQPPTFDVAKFHAANRALDEQRKSLLDTIQQSRTELDDLVIPIRESLLAAKSKAGGSKKPVDLQPIAAWDFEGNLKDSLTSHELKAHGKISYKDGMVVLNNAYLQSDRLPSDLTEKTMEVWIKVNNVDQRGGGAMTVEMGHVFDSIVLGERKNRHWISGSDGFSRTQDFPNSTPEEKPNEMLHLTMVYLKDGTTTLYRNGKPYGKPYRSRGAMTFPKDKSRILFGIRHSPANQGKYLTMSLDKARLYDRPLTPEEVAASSGNTLFVTDAEIEQALTAAQRSRKTELEKTLSVSEVALQKVPKNQDLGKQQREVIKRFEDGIRNKMRSRSFQRTALSDPRYGGILTNAATLTMTSGPMRTKPISRGSWVIEVIFNDPPAPPPNDVPPLDESDGLKTMTIRQKFIEHRQNKRCASCHERIDPLGFALENFDGVGRWRETYDSNLKVDSAGTLFRKYPFKDIVEFKQALVKEDKRFARAFTGHLLRFALSRELTPADSITVDDIVAKTGEDDYRLRSIIKEIILSKSFAGAPSVGSR